AASRADVVVDVAVADLGAVGSRRGGCGKIEADAGPAQADLRVRAGVSGTPAVLAAVGDGGAGGALAERVAGHVAGRKGKEHRGKRGTGNAGGHSTAVRTPG